MSTPSARGPAPARSALPVLQIRNWPARQQPYLAGTFALAILLLGLGISWSTSHSLSGVIAIVTLFVASWRMWVPVRFELDARGIQQTLWRWRKFIPWSAIVAHQADSDGVLLTRRPHDAPGSCLDGLYIYGDNRPASLRDLVHFYTRHAEGDLDITRSASILP